MNDVIANRALGWVPAFLIAAVLGGPAPGAWAARTFIDIYSPGARKIRLAIPELRPLEGRRDPVGLQIAQVVQEDLARTGLFFVQDRKSYPENPLQAGIRLEEQKFPEWLNVVKVEALIKGGYTLSGDSIVAEMFLYDTARSAQELGKRYQYPRSSWRLMAHRFANAVLERFTGEKGVFDTQIAFVSRRSDTERGEIYIMDWDGADLRRVTRNGMGNNAPSWSPDGRWLAYSSDESGAFEVYVRAFPGPGPRYPVSSGGGLAPRWNPRGGELFYLARDSLIAVPVRSTGTALELGRGTALFSNRFAPLNFHAPYDVAPDGSWFVFTGTASTEFSSGFRMVLNWFDQPWKQ